jgi:hypothetical protein
MLCYRSAGMAACIVCGRLVFLDLLGDRYFALEPVQDASARALLHDSTVPREAGLEPNAIPVLTSQIFLPVAIAAVTSSAITAPLPRPFASLVAAALLRNLHALIEVQILPLNRIVTRVRRSRRAQPQAACSSFNAILAAHLASHRLLSARDRCLPYSIALARHLRQHQIAVDLVFGVRVDPFAAHAWVQRDGMVLNDTLEHARSFQPILVL